MTAVDKSKLTRAANLLAKWNKKYMEASYSPYLEAKLRAAQTKYHNTVSEIKQRYKGVNLQMQI
jgi:hypothetical protein